MHLHLTIQWDLTPWFGNWSSSQDDLVQSRAGMVCTAWSYKKYNWRRHSVRKKIWIISVTEIFSYLNWYLPSWIFKQISEDGVRYFGIVVTHSNITTPYLIFAKNLLDSLQYTSLALNEKYEFWFEYYCLFPSLSYYCFFNF